jgi:hypothetical protein
MRSVFSACLAIALSSVSYGQNDPCGCNVALLDGVYNQRVLRNDQNARLDVVSRLAYMTYDEYKNATNANGGASFLGFGFNAGMTRDEFSRRQSELRTEYAANMSNVTNQELVERYGDQTVMTAWSQCKSNCNRSGLISWIEIRDPDNAALQLRWTPPPGPAAPLLVSASHVEGATVVGAEDPSIPFRHRQQIPVGTTNVPLRRSSRDMPIWIHVDIPGYSVLEFIPKYIPPLPPPPPPTPPTLLCHSTPADGLNSVSISVAASCNGCSAKTAAKDSWQAMATSVTTNWQAPRRDWLSASAAASVNLACELTANGYHVGLQASHSSLAGWGGVPNDYRWSASSISGQAQSGFEVKAPGQFCMLIANYAQSGNRTKGYPGSYLFPEGPIPGPSVTFFDPAGGSISPVQGTAVPLDKPGRWRVVIPISAAHTSGWSENSGSFTYSTNLVFRFVPKTAAGACP